METYLHKRERTRAQEKFFLLTRENAPALWEKGKNIKMLRRASAVFLLAFFLNLSGDINNQTLLCPLFFSFSVSFCRERMSIEEEREREREEKKKNGFSEAITYTFPQTHTMYVLLCY